MTAATDHEHTCSFTKTYYLVGFGHHNRGDGRMRFAVRIGEHKSKRKNKVLMPDRFAGCCDKTFFFAGIFIILRA